VLFVTRFAPPPFHLPQSVAQGFNLPLVHVLLHFGEFEGLKDFFHLIEHLLQRCDDLIDLGDGIRNSGGRCWLEIAPFRPLGIGTFRMIRRVFPFFLSLTNEFFGRFVPRFLNG